MGFMNTASEGKEGTRNNETKSTMSLNLKVMKEWDIDSQGKTINSLSLLF